MVSPVKAFEYMAFGLPIVAFDLREMRELADEAAHYAPPGDTERFASLISDLLDDPEGRRRLGRTGRRRVEEFLAWDHQEPLYVGVFDRVLHRHGDGVVRPRSGTADGRDRGRRPRVSVGSPEL
jgi:glycosyltransferase involved in cell wall biosynthesis